MAVAFHPDFEYVALAASGDPKAPDRRRSGLHRRRRTRRLPSSPPASWATTTELARFKGSKLEHTTFKHPFLERSILGVLATYVTADTGTGAVHTAPSHGADDFYTGQRYDLDQTCRVDAAGHLHVDPDAWPLAAPPPFEGKKVWAANPIIVAMLEERGALLASADLEHSYPHCWRCHHPVIFRATEQWFISLETPIKRADGSETTFRQLAIEEIDKVVWDPAWGKERITNMIATRPDWCISRQRIWGVPIAVFLCEGCNQPILDPALNRKIIDLFEREGVEAWHTTPIAALLARRRAHARICGGKGFRKETDILDVWFDSGTSWFAVCESDPELKPAYKDFQKRTNGTGGASISKAAISTAAGSTLRCSPRWLCAAARPIRTSPPPAGPSTNRAAPCRNRSATASTPSTSPSAWAAKSSASGSRPSISAKTWPPAKT